MSKKTRKIVLLPLLLSILLENIIAMHEPPTIVDLTWRENAHNLYPSKDYYTSGYEIWDSKYIPNNGDPQIGFLISERDIQSVIVLFSQPVQDDLAIQVYYAVSGEELSELNSVHSEIKRDSMSAVIQLPAGQYTQLRLDVEGSFYLSEVYTTAERIHTRWPINVIRLFALWAALVLFIVIQKNVILPNRNRIRQCLYVHRQRIGITLILCTAFTAYLMLAINLPMEFAPDEDMRNDIPFWMYEHNTFPVGDEIELISGNGWGFSYGFSPCRLPTILAWLMMHIFAIFVEEEMSLLLATRFVSILASLGSIYLGYLTGKKYCRNSWSKYLFAIFIGFLPQVVFLSSYYNCDAVSIFGCCLILYNLVSGRETHWSIRTCVGLSIGISTCLLSYFNSYGWILVSIVFCLISAVQDRTITSKFQFIGLRVLLVTVIVLTLSGWSFLRNALLYDGDFLAMSATSDCALEWEAAGNSIYIPVPPISEGMPLWDMLTIRGWIKTSAKSFIAGMGALTVFLSDSSYRIYAYILIIGLLVGIYSICIKKKDILMLTTLIIASFIPIILSIIYSYTRDYQAQGRYLMPMLPALAMIVVQGYDYLAEILVDRRRYYIFSGTPERIYDKPLISIRFNPACIMCCLWLLMFIVAYFRTIIPELFK